MRWSTWLAAIGILFEIGGLLLIIRRAGAGAGTALRAATERIERFATMVVTRLGRSGHTHQVELAEEVDIASTTTAYATDRLDEKGVPPTPEERINALEDRIARERAQRAEQIEQLVGELRQDLSQQEKEEKEKSDRFTWQATVLILFGALLQLIAVFG